MLWLNLMQSAVIVGCLHCIVKGFVLSGTPHLPVENYHYELVPNHLNWNATLQVCAQKSGALARVSSDIENRQLTKFLQSLNITQPVWIAGKVMTQINDFQMSPMSHSFILQFSGHSDRKSARLLRAFPPMNAVTVCSQVLFELGCHGVSTVFSYSISSFANEFQLQAQVPLLERGAAIQFTLLVHGNVGLSVAALQNDGAWHSVCVSWSSDKGNWEIWTDGQLVDLGHGLYPGEDIGGDGVFIVGQGQEGDGYGKRFRSGESLCGSVTQLHVWDRALDSIEIQTMEKECSPISPGLLYKWSASALEIEPSLKNYWGNSPCQGNSSLLASQLLVPQLETSWQYQNFSAQTVLFPNTGACVTIDPMSGGWGLDMCQSHKVGVCQVLKSGLDVFPRTDLFSKAIEEIYFNSSAATDLSRLSDLIAVLLGVLETGPGVVMPIDVLHLTQMIERAASTQIYTANASREAVVSLATDYLRLASEMITPDMAAQWMDSPEGEASPKPFTIIQSIDKLTWALADVLWKEGKSFTISTKNIDVHLEPRKLTQMSCSCVYKPSAFGSQSSKSQDEILIPDTEVQRLHALGHRDVMFIHTYYSHLKDLETDEQQTHSSEEVKSGQSPQTGHLSSAVISATVRDVSKSANVPVSVHYTLSAPGVVEYSRLVTPMCVFWNFSLMASSQASSWSTEGCRVTQSDSTGTACFCNHTTNFAVLMNYLEATWSPQEQSILTKLTFIGSGASLCALMVTLMLFTVLDIPKSDRTSIHKNLFIALTCAQVVLLCSGSAINNKVACTLVAALLHLFFMAAFSWMLVEGLLLWSKVVTVNLSEDRHMKYYYLIGWGLPVVIVTITLASASGRYAADGHCWLSVQNGVIWGFAGPVIFIIMVNIMVLARVVGITITTAKRRSLMMAVNSSPMEQAYEQIRAAVKAVLVLLPILGLTWLCGVLVPFSIVMAYIFVILNSLQVRSTVNRIKERRKALNFSNCASSRPSSSITSSRPGSSPAAGPQGLGAPLSSHCDSTSLEGESATYTSRSE
ncbi:adhesion G-protein coupled receptor D2 isoform X2 [Clupea harengus]|uniref:Adhesion G-protein coupled receptor D2 isoform X2 n=1 Tax=Clupea harengus TaxID=7950 RepID=A0A6P8G6Q5_CLUHA|nr:adhesion G-protein coupled receptor D2 isoform X2 [Clupea harengus]